MVIAKYQVTVRTPLASSLSDEDLHIVDLALRFIDVDFERCIMSTLRESLSAEQLKEVHVEVEDL